MAKTQTTYPTTIDSTLSTDRSAGDLITSDSYDILETAVYQLETKLGAGTGLSAATVSGTTLCGSNIYATTVTATNLSATNLSAVDPRFYDPTGAVYSEFTNIAGGGGAQGALLNQSSGPIFIGTGRAQGNDGNLAFRSWISKGYDFWFANYVANSTLDMWKKNGSQGFTYYSETGDVGVSNTLSSTNVYATTVTATNLTATNISATTYENAGLVWTSVAGTTVTMTGNNGYIMNNAGILSATMPATCTLGHTIEIAGLGAGGWRIIQLAGQTIHFGNLDTTTGATGYLSASLAHDCVRLICVTANTDFVVASSIGNIVIA